MHSDMFLVYAPRTPELRTAASRRRLVINNQHIEVLKVLLAHPKHEVLQERACTVLWLLSADRAF